MDRTVGEVCLIPGIDIALVLISDKEIHPRFLMHREFNTCWKFIRVTRRWNLVF